MNKRYKHIIFFDTEFISTRRKNQPIEISLIAYDIVDNELKYDKSFFFLYTTQKSTHFWGTLDKTCCWPDNGASKKVKISLNHKMLELKSFYLPHLKT